MMSLMQDMGKLARYLDKRKIAKQAEDAALLKSLGPWTEFKETIGDEEVKFAMWQIKNEDDVYGVLVCEIGRNGPKLDKQQFYSLAFLNAMIDAVADGSKIG